MKKTIKFTAIILFIGIVMASCGTKDNRLRKYIADNISKEQMRQKPLRAKEQRAKRLVVKTYSNSKKLV